MKDETQPEFLTEDAHGIYYSETIQHGWAALFFAICLIGLGPPIQALLGQEVRPVLASRGAEIFRVLFFLAFSIGAGLAVLRALQRQRLLFDRESQRLTGRVTGRFMLLTDLDISFDQLDPPVIQRRVNDEQVETFTVALGCSGGRAVTMYGWKDGAIAEEWAQRIGRLVGAKMPQSDAGIQAR